MDSQSDELIDNIVKKIVQQELVNSKLNLTSQPGSGSNQGGNPVQTSISEIECTSKKKVISIGTDHGGVELKEIIKKELTEQGYLIIDCGTNTKDPVDYPDIAFDVSRLVASGEAWRGIVIDGAGIGSCMAANKVKGIRAAMCYDNASAMNSREHNDANVLTLGAGLIGVNLAKQIVKTWLATEFGGGRHAKRVNKITELDRR